MSCHTCLDGVIYKKEIAALCRGETGSSRGDDDSSRWASMLLLMPVRLGIEAVNPIYMSALTSCLSLSQTVGIAGGKSNGSLIFVGHEGSDTRIDPSR
jgi:hypothetical protein